MSSTRIYQPVSLQVGAIITLDEKASHHIARVLRAATNEKITLFNGQGGEFDAVITRIDKKKVEVKLLDFSAREAESPLEIHLAQGIARGEKMDFIVQKAVELGVTHIIPLMTERCNVRLDSEREEKRLVHWQSVAVSACEQSGRNRIPTIAAPTTLSAWLAQVQVDCAFVLSPHVETKLHHRDLAPFSSAALLIGPEGGLSPAEVTLAQQQRFQPVNLGPRILRTETATIAALTWLQAHFGDMKISN